MKNIFLAFILLLIPFALPLISPGVLYFILSPLASIGYANLVVTVIYSIILLGSIFFSYKGFKTGESKFITIILMVLAGLMLLQYLRSIFYMIMYSR